MTAPIATGTKNIVADDPNSKKRKLSEITAGATGSTSGAVSSADAPPADTDPAPDAEKAATATPGPAAAAPLPHFSAAWRSELDHSCNRLLSQYAALLRSASATPSGIVENEPSASLSAATTISSLRTKLSAQNISVACARILDLIRTLRLSVLTMGTEHTEEEHGVVVQEMMAKIEQDVDASLELGGEIVQLQGRLK